MKMGNRLGRAIVVALALAGTAVPAGAQNYSDAYNFIKAVKERDGTKVQAIVATPGSIAINSRDRGSGEGALHMLVRDRDYGWLSFMLSHGARPDLQNKEGNTPLALAAQIGWIEGAQVLLQRRATVDLPNSQGETPLILAVHRRDLAMVRLLLGRGANPNRGDSAAGYSALEYARRDPRAAAIVRLLEVPPKPARPVAGPGL